MIKPILFLFSILAIASSLDAKVEKDFFFVGNNNKFKSTLFQTSTHVIVQSIEFPSNSQPVPQYLALDLTTGNATQILADVSAACDPATYLFGKLIYHDASSKLVYYCANNNTVLFIDQEGFKVNDYISVGGSVVYNETRLIADGDNLVILGIVDFFGQEPTDTQFIRVDLISRQVISDFSLAGYLKTPQTIVAFASSKLEQYVLASSTDGQNETISLYFMLWAQDVLKLVPVTSTTYNTNGTSVIHHLYCYGTYVVTNTATDMIVVNQVGTVLYTYPNLTSTKIYTSPKNFAWELSYGKQYESKDLYVLFNNDTIYQLALSGTSISAGPIGTASQMMVVIGSTQQDDLLFVISDQGPLFNVIKATTQDILYSRPNAYRNLMITNTTYAAELYPYLFIFDSSKDTVIANVTIGLFYYHDTDHGVVYFLNSTGSYNETTCTLLSLDLTTAKFNSIFTFPNASACVGTITAVDATDPAHPQVSILLYNTSLLILTTKYGLLTFVPPAPTSGRNAVAYSVVDFGTLNLEYIHSQDSQAFTVDFYTYDPSTNSFNTSLGYGFNVGSPFPISNIYTVGSHEIIAVSNKAFAYLNVSASSPVLYNTSFIRAQMSKFHDDNGNLYTIFTEDPRYNLIRSVQPPALFDLANLNQLPETSTNTTQAGAAGFCSFWTVEGMITSVGVVKFYNGCSGSRTESIYA